MRAIPIHKLTLPGVCSFCGTVLRGSDEKAVRVCILCREAK